MMKLCSTPHIKVLEFRRGRKRLSDEEFIVGCGLERSQANDCVVIAVRRAVANVGLVDSQFIYPADVYPDQLGVLPLWDSMDWITFEMELADELKRELPDELLPYPGFNYRRFAVAELVKASQR